MRRRTASSTYRGWAPQFFWKRYRLQSPPLTASEYARYVEACRRMFRQFDKQGETVWDPGLRAWCRLPPLED